MIARHQKGIRLVVVACDLLGAIFGLMLLVLSTVALASESPISSRLVGLDGKERLEVLISLTEELVSEDPQQAIRYGLEALELLETYPSDQSAFQVLTRTTFAYVALGEIDAATDHSDKALILSERLGDAESRARGLMAKVAVLNSQARYEESLVLAKEAQLWAKQQDDTEVLGTAFNLEGNVHFETGNPAEAIERYFAALTAFEEGQALPRVAMALNNIGSVYLSIENFDESLKYYSRALEYSEQLGNRELSAILSLNMATIYGELGNRQEELARYEDALAISRELGHKHLIATALINLSEVYLGQERNDLAIETARQALTMSQQLDNPLMEAISAMNVGQGLLSAGEEAEAMGFLDRALSTAESVGAVLQTQEFLQIISQTYEELGDYQSSLAFFKRFKEASDQLTTAQSQERIAEVEARYETARQEKEIEILTRDRELQSLALEQQRNARNSFIVVTVLLGLLVAILVQRFRFKAKAHRQLTAISQELERQAFTDSLTKLHNRRYFVGAIQPIVESVLDGRASGNASAGFSILAIDIDHFKRINDAHGHEFGDKVLVEFAHRLRSLIKSDDILARWGGEEFLLLSNNSDFEAGASMSERIVGRLANRPFTIGDVTIELHCSVGFTNFPFLPGDNDRVSWEQLLRIADNALYLAKQGGRNTWIGVQALRDSLAEDELVCLLENVDDARQKGLVRLRERTFESLLNH